MTTADEASTLLELVRRHVEGHLGPPRQVVTLAGLGLPQVSLALYPPEKANGPFVLTTIGASLATTPRGQRVEGVIVARVAVETVDAVASLLASFAQRITDPGVEIGQLIPVPPQLREQLHMDAALILPPIPFAAEFAHATTQDLRIDVLWLLPLFASEAEYVLEHGPQRLLTAFSEAGIDPLSASRRAITQDHTSTSRSGPEGAPEPEEKSSQPSYALMPSGNDLVVRRRGAKTSGMTWRPPPVQLEPEPEPIAENEMKPKRRPLFLDKEPEAVRFELPEHLRRAPPPKSPEQERQDEIDQLTEAQNRIAQDQNLSKKERIEALKALAREAEDRASARNRGDTVAAKLNPPRPGSNISSEAVAQAEAAALRRGAPKQAIQSQLKKQKADPEE